MSFKTPGEVLTQTQYYPSAKTRDWYQLVTKAMQEYADQFINLLGAVESRHEKKLNPSPGAASAYLPVPFTKKENLLVADSMIDRIQHGTKDILPCPFCQNDSIIVGGWKNETSGNVVVTIFCNDTFGCGAGLNMCVTDTAEKIAAAEISLVQRWNRYKSVK